MSSLGIRFKSKPNVQLTPENNSWQHCKLVSTDLATLSSNYQCFAAIINFMIDTLLPNLHNSLMKEKKAIKAHLKSSQSTMKIKKKHIKQFNQI